MAEKGTKVSCLMLGEIMRYPNGTCKGILGWESCAVVISAKSDWGEAEGAHSLQIDQYYIGRQVELQEEGKVIETMQSQSHNAL